MSKSRTLVILGVIHCRQNPFDSTSCMVSSASTKTLLRYCLQQKYPLHEQKVLMKQLSRFLLGIEIWNRKQQFITSTDVAWRGFQGAGHQVGHLPKMVHCWVWSFARILGMQVSLYLNFFDERFNVTTRRAFLQERYSMLPSLRLEEYGCDNANGLTILFKPRNHTGIHVPPWS
jgi:hypothetical protein